MVHWFARPPSLPAQTGTFHVHGALVRLLALHGRANQHLPKAGQRPSMVHWFAHRHPWLRKPAPSMVHCFTARLTDKIWRLWSTWVV